MTTELPSFANLQDLDSNFKSGKTCKNDTKGKRFDF